LRVAPALGPALNRHHVLSSVLWAAIVEIGIFADEAAAGC
jgi:hypothetical protein